MPPVAKGYLSAQEIVTASRAAGIPVGEYVERYVSKDTCPFSREGGLGHTKETIDRLLAHVALPKEAHCLEIGPGTGRYHAELWSRRPDLTYEFYETSSDWAAWLSGEYGSRGARGRNADGRSLKETPSASVDLCSAHGVFVYIDTMVTFSYLKEACRCLKSGGHLYFDIVDMDRDDILDVVDKYMAQCFYLIPVSLRVVLQYLRALGMEPVATFIPADVNETSTYVLQRRVTSQLRRTPTS